MIKKIDKIAISNRGEIAVRIIRSCQELGIKTVLLHSDVDQNSIAYRISDEQICIGSAEATDSYLNLDSVIEGAISSQAQAIHPGVGFLSENADLAKACEKKGILFIGPHSDFLSLFSNKKALCDEVKKLGIPTLPSFLIEEEILSSILRFKEKRNTLSVNEKNEEYEKNLNIIQSKALEIGYPLMIKINEGGGGKGLRKVSSKEHLFEAIVRAFQEGKRTFQSEHVFLEKYLSGARHIEVQIFVSADGDFFYLGTRDCSIQRKHQKVIEEAPASNLTPKVEQKMINASFEFFKKFKSYRNAGTLEFLVHEEECYFIEMNPRLQVEHTVTEMVLGIDIVKAQILTAQNKPLLWDWNFKTSDKILQKISYSKGLKGHAIECRILAENYDLFLRDGNIWPSSGHLGHFYCPLGPGRRFDIGFETNDEITPFYDSLIGKVIVQDESRIRSIQKMRKTLMDTILFGVKTNISFLISVLEHPDYIKGNTSTDFLSHLTEDFLNEKKHHHAPSKKFLLYKGQEDLSGQDIRVAKKILEHFKEEPSPGHSLPFSSRDKSPWTHKWV